MDYRLDSDISSLGRLLPTQKKALKRLGIVTVRDLLYHFPTRYSDMSAVRMIADLEPGQPATVYGKLSGLKTKKSFRTKRPMAEGKLTDLSGNTLKITWFNQAYLAKMVEADTLVKLTGPITDSKYGLTMTNPEVESTPDLPIDNHESLFANSDEQKKFFGYPVYRESRGITSRWMYHAIKKVMANEVFDTLVDPIPVEIRERYHLPDLRTALIWIHTPQRQSDAEVAKKRFAFEEIFFVQLDQYQERQKYNQLGAESVKPDPAKIEKFIKQFPFTPTGAQQRVLGEITADLQQTSPMSRLVEGDVGSGKTFVAAVSTYAVATAKPTDQTFGNLQVAYMAPTAVLATQLFESFIEYFHTTGLSIVLLTGSTCRKYPSKVNPKSWTDISRNQALKWIDNGEIPIVIGTHALIQKKVNFKHLGLVIIDEQHRFGTNQRLKLARKDGHVPHYLSMTATPIPRTLALTLYGNLELSVIDEMPKGRKTVDTTIVRPDGREAVYDAIRDRLADGRQAYVICPRINDPDPEKENALQLKSVKSEAKRLAEKVFPNYTIDIMHSKMKKAPKEAAMERFFDHETDVLVSTSVVEVGVNVPNATSIIIEGAERFGLSQLHQLRGRVMRSSHQPYCYLFTDSKNAKSHTRLKNLAKTTNGFELAELDMAERGIGDLWGKKQWGISDLAMNALKNPRLVQAARQEAKTLVENDQLSQYPDLMAAVSQRQQVHME
jgi:ATP-dependent DNA helicase RecG